MSSNKGNLHQILSPCRVPLILYRGEKRVLGVAETDLTHLLAYPAMLNFDYLIVLAFVELVTVESNLATLSTLVFKIYILLV